MADFIDEIHTLDVPGAQLHVERVGPTDAPAVLYLHGGPGYNSHSFRSLMEDDLSRYQMIYADQRGGGRSPANGPFGLDELAADVGRILDQLGLPTATLLAHGFGATIAITAATQQPERYPKLLLVGPWVDMPLLSRDLQREAALQSGNQAEALPPESSLNPGEAPEPDELLEQTFDWMAGKQLLDAMQFPKASSRLHLEHSDAELLAGDDAGLLPAGFWSLSVTNLLPALQARVIVLVGQDDKTSYPNQAERVLLERPDALVSLLDAGHYPWLDDADTFTSLVHQVMAL
ncbi:MAG TPA: alpha/beta hydrolase [Trueperaceae bacterium]